MKAVLRSGKVRFVAGGAIVAALLICAALVGVNRGIHDADRTARRVSERVEKRLGRLDYLAAILLDRHDEAWPELGDVPSDMVLYRYVSDTLNCWYNLFSVMSDDISKVRLVADPSGPHRLVPSTLAMAGPVPQLVSMGGQWYILKSYMGQYGKVIAGLMIMGHPSPGDSGINPHLLKSGKYTVTTLENEGSVVYAGSVPLFKITDRGAVMQTPFSLLLNSDAGWFGSVGDVLFYNTVIFLLAIILYLRRKNILALCRGRRRLAPVIACACAVACAGVMWYCMSALSAVVGNSPIVLTPRRFTSLDRYSLFAGISFATLCTSAFLLADLGLSVFCIIRGRRFSIRRTLPAFVFAVVFSSAMCVQITRCELEREQKILAVICERIVTEPVHHSSHFLPPFFSYAKYTDGRLVDFKGNFAYPLVLPREYVRIHDNSTQRSILSDGFRHFINYVDDADMVILSREEMGFMSFIVMFTVLVIFLFALMWPFRARDRGNTGRANFFSTRIRRLIILSLVSTLFVMAAVSVLFFHDRNEHLNREMMSSRISSVQTLLNSCNGNMGKLMETARNAQGTVMLYSPSGRLISSGRQDFLRPLTLKSRLDPEAYRKIMFDHRRYCILERELSGHSSYVLYAPVVNARGGIVAIACVPFDKDMNMVRDAVYHAVTLVSVFIIILFIVILVVSSITASIFMPLREMGRKMSAAASSSGMELIEYDGNDEISVLVDSYNRMVLAMRSGAVQMAQAERDRAWSEMARQVAHEIKNPLTPIKLEIQRIMRLKQKGDPQWEEKFDKASAIVLEHIDILSQTANEFSTFAKLYSEPPVEIDLNRLLQDQIFLFEDRGIRITFLGMEEAVCKGPRPQLTRVFFNILNNAVQAVADREEPRIVVSIRRGDSPQQGLVVSVEDNGQGVGEENIERLFTPNFTTKSGGTGLGLAICRNVVESCGGTIGYSRSFSLGGACFSVSLPTE